MLLHSKFPVFFWFLVQHVPLVKWVHVHLYFARQCRKFHGRIAFIRSSRGTEQRKNRYLFSLYFYVVPADAQCSVNSNRFDFILLFFLSVSLSILCVRAYVWACFVVLHRICWPWWRRRRLWSDSISQPRWKYMIKSMAIHSIVECTKTVSTCSVHLTAENEYKQNQRRERYS